MGGKKSIIAMFLVVILAGGAGLGYAWHRESVNARTFSGSGYVLNPNTEMINRASEHASDGVYLIDVETDTRIRLLPCTVHGLQQG